MQDVDQLATIQKVPQYRILYQYCQSEIMVLVFDDTCIKVYENIVQIMSVKSRVRIYRN